MRRPDHITPSAGRKERQKDRDIIELDQVTYKLSDQENIQEEIESKEKIKLLNEAIQKLSYEKKEVIILSKLKELKYKEIGKIIGCSEANARIKAHRALQDLKTTYLSMQKF